MSKSIHDYVVESLKASDVEAVERDTGISKWTLMKIRQRQIRNPGIKGIETLCRYFKAREAKDLRRRSTA